MFIFLCRKCGNEIELPKLPEGPVPCECGDVMTRRYTAPNVIYKVSGFYSVDKRLTPVDPIDYDPEVD